MYYQSHRLGSGICCCIFLKKTNILDRNHEDDIHGLMCGNCCQLFILSLPRLNVHMHCSRLYFKSYYTSFFTFTDLLGSLKSRLSKLMPSENVKRYIVPWSETGRINQNEHSSYLKQLGQDFFEQAKRIIDESAANESLASKVFPNAVVLVLSPGGHLVHIQE